jgi:hypothetical protein
LSGGEAGWQGFYQSGRGKTIGGPVPAARAELAEVDFSISSISNNFLD